MAVLTYKYRLKDGSAAKRLRRHAFACNQVWNYCNAMQRDIEARYRAGAPKRKWPTHFGFTYLTAGTSKLLGTNAQTVGLVCQRYAQSRTENRGSLRFRASRGPRRALGWVPFHPAGRTVDGNSIVFAGDRYRWFGNRRRPLPATARGGAFVEDSRGRWWVTFRVEVDQSAAPQRSEIGIDLGLKTLATLSDGETVPALRHYRTYERKLAVAQRAGNKHRVKAIHAKIANCRKDQIHKATTKIARENSLIVVGNVNAAALKKTRMGKSVSDAGWSMFRNALRYKASRHGGAYLEVNEAFTSLTCSECESTGGPKGIAGLGMRVWDCPDCGASHDRDVNAARNILRLGLSIQAHADESRAQPIADRYDHEP